MGKKIYVVTHGDKVSGPNPGMTPKGYDQIYALQRYLPEEIKNVVCGTGKRHRGVANMLGLTPNRFSSIFGDSDSMESVDGQKKIVLPDGTYLDPKTYSTLEDLTPITKTIVTQLPDGTVVCSGRPLMIVLGQPQAQMAQVWLLTVEGENIAFELLSK